MKKHKYTEEDLDKAYKCADEVQYRRGYEDAKKEIEKQDEQKPVDKIEQEYHCTGVREPKEATGVLKQLLNKENYAEFVAKYLEERWKPTERMLEALKWAKCEFHPDCPETMEQLKYLYQELKQLYYDRT